MSVSVSIVPRNLELFRKLTQKKIAVGFIRVPDLSESSSPMQAKIVQLRDITDSRRHVIVNFDMEGRLISAELGREFLGNEVKILERSFDGEFYIYWKNCENLRPGHEGVYYYYDYYNEGVFKNSQTAEILVRCITALLEDISKRGYEASNDIKFTELRIVEDQLDTSINIAKISQDLLEIFENARVKYNWEGLLKQRVSLKKIYPTPVSVIPPEVRPDRNPIFAVIQITQGCWIQDTRGPCRFCNSYRGIPYREKGIDELIDHIKKVKEFTGKGWNQVKKLFLSDADPLHTKIDSEVYLKTLAKEIPEAVWYEAFVSTPTILSKSESQWSNLKALGLKRLYWGVESADDETLKLLGKPQTKEKLYEAAYRLKDAGISLAIIVLSGVGALTPNRTEAEVVSNLHIQETAKFIKDVGCSIVYVSKLVPQPGTEIFDLMQSGKLKPLSPSELEKQHRAMIKMIKMFCNSCEVRGAYGVQFVCPYHPS
jgi:MoaA/NifB/PqqE/SkfB family radical SAM enzyme